MLLLLLPSLRLVFTLLRYQVSHLGPPLHAHYPQPNSTLCALLFNLVSIALASFATHSFPYDTNLPPTSCYSFGGTATAALNSTNNRKASCSLKNGGYGRVVAVVVKQTTTVVVMVVVVIGEKGGVSGGWRD